MSKRTEQLGKRKLQLYPLTALIRIMFLDKQNSINAAEVSHSIFVNGARFIRITLIRPH